MNASATYRLGRHDVRTLRTAAGYRGRVVLGPKNFVDAEAGTIEGVLARIEIALAERTSTARAARVAGIPTADEYLCALHRLGQQGEFGQHHQRMLAALHKAPARTLSAGDLAGAAGWGSYEAANSHLGSFAKMMALELGYQPAETGSDGVPTWTYTLATAAPERSPEGHFRWQMRPELAAALERWWGSHPAA